jgi:hypothetical protein
MQSDARPWVREGKKMRCSRHNVTFVLPHTCDACNEDPGPPLEEEPDAPVKAPKGCRTVEEHERWFVALANAAQASANALAKLRRLPKKKKKAKGIEVVDVTAGPVIEDLRDFHDEAAIAKHREVALKANRAAAGLAIRRTDDVLVNAREKRIQDRARGAAARAGGGH